MELVPILGSLYRRKTGLTMHWVFFCYSFILEGQALSWHCWSDTRMEGNESRKTSNQQVMACGPYCSGRKSIILPA